MEVGRMKEIVFLLLLVLCVDGFLFMGQTIVLDINPDAQRFYNYEGTLIKDNDAGNYTLNEDVTAKLPTGTASVSPDTGNFFTDIFATAKNWLLESTGLSYVLAIVNALPNFLKILGLPSIFVFIVGSIWHTFTIFLFVLLLLGKD
jgi:hypothetical protein